MKNFNPIGTDIKGFIFDMDGVITETSENHYLAWKLLASHIGIHIDRTMNERLKGVSRMDALNIILAHGHKEVVYSEQEKMALAEKKNNHYVEMIQQFDSSNLMDGIEPMFIELKKRGYKIGIASASHSAKKLIKYLGIKQYIDYVVEPSNLKGKPEPDIFLAAAKGLGLKPEHCVGIEDAIAGVEAIKAAGMFAVGIGDYRVLKNADIIYEAPSAMQLDEILIQCKRD